MKFGVTFTLRHLPEEDVRDIYAATLNAAEVVEELGYDYALVSEHHFTGDGYLPSLLPMLAAFASRTSRIGIGTNLLLLPLHHPVRVAEDAAVVDLISEGRLTLGVGAGYKIEEFEGLGVDRRQRGVLMEKYVPTLRAAWANQEVNGVRVSPQPASDIPIWIGGFEQPAVDRAVRLGNGYMIGGGRQRVAGVKVEPGSPYAYYLEALDKHGRSAADVPLIGNRVVHVADTDEQAWAEVGEALLWQHNLYAQWFRDVGETGGGLGAASVNDLPVDDYIVGSPETCIAQLEAYTAAMPVDVTTFTGHVPGTPFEVALRSLQLFAEEVMPMFRTTASPAPG